MKENDRNLIEKYLKGLTNDEENQLVESIIITEEKASELKDLLENEWEKTENQSLLNIEKLENLLDRVHHLISQKEYEERKTVLRKVLNIYARVAAILIIPLIISGIIGYSHLAKQRIETAQIIKDEPPEILKSTIIAPMGSRVSFTLPDSTTGMLNSGSRLTYSVPFKRNRNIDLEGEAWFDVKHDEQNPFVIGAGNSKVKVLGTSFNISAYPNDGYIEVVLCRGKIQFTDQNGASNTTLYPSERLVYQNGNISKTVTDPAKYSSWKEGKLVFRGDQMSEVGRRIERWYNVKVILEDKELEKYSFRGTFVDDSLEEVLNLLSMTSPITYRITPRRIQNDGTYEKEIVTINLKK